MTVNVVLAVGTSIVPPPASRLIVLEAESVPVTESVPPEKLMALVTLPPSRLAALTAPPELMLSVPVPTFPTVIPPATVQAELPVPLPTFTVPVLPESDPIVTSDAETLPPPIMVRRRHYHRCRP